jgi:hypothetical protein
VEISGGVRDKTGEKTEVNEKKICDVVKRASERKFE